MDEQKQVYQKTCTDEIVSDELKRWLRNRDNDEQQQQQQKKTYEEKESQSDGSKALRESFTYYLLIMNECQKGKCYKALTFISAVMLIKRWNETP